MAIRQKTYEGLAGYEDWMGSEGIELARILIPGERN